MQSSDQPFADHLEPAEPTAREWGDVLLRILSDRAGRPPADFNQAAQLARTTAERIGAPAGAMPVLSLAARLHDIGKIAVPVDILRKPGPLDDAEWALMRKHAAAGEHMLRAAPALSGVATLVRHHHERYDGRGYPDGLDGRRTPLGAQVITVCAAFVAMMKQRPYSDAITVAEAIAELRRGSGSQFNPAVVDAFCAGFD
jgi:response regulator RpfG family c-di-GMP phosphodiesterase